MSCITNILIVPYIGRQTFTWIGKSFHLELKDESQVEAPDKILLFGVTL